MRDRQRHHFPIVLLNEKCQQGAELHTTCHFCIVDALLQSSAHCPPGMTYGGIPPSLGPHLSISSKGPIGSKCKKTLTKERPV